MGKKGFTLLEVIIAILILSIVILAAIPAFYSQLITLQEGKTLTEKAFEIQGEIEREITEIKRRTLEENPSLEKEEIELFGKKVSLSKGEVNLKNNSSITFYISRQLTLRRKKNPPVAKGVNIQISTDPNNFTADIDKNPLIEGFYQVEEGDNPYYLSLYQWYVSREGIVDPQFPQDYTLVSTGKIFSNYKNYPNRFAIFTVVPVDAFGLRGREISSQTIYIRGNDWKDGHFPWVDLNGNGVYDEGTDVRLNLEQLYDLDTARGIYDEDLNLIPLEGGSLYFPRNIQLELTGDQRINWNVCKSIHFAGKIVGLNSTDITINSREGSITFHERIGEDIAIKTEGDVIITTEGRGNINIQKNNGINGGGRLTLAPKGRINIWETQIIASDIILDTQRDNFLAGNRTIALTDSHLLLKHKANHSGNILIKTSHDFIMERGSIREIGGNGKLILQVLGDIKLPPIVDIDIY
ncbi:prepilin-type N-terminal cleavage/methylation domain-containing protein [Anaerobranca gottschalkii]|uniref:Prepilin-type N-terminal cleavage/methylation domain-containing protein n=1 Tax=Anaerobranca gottschalkii DSM 13577 TaxID=1120990 RepID=A0A1H9Y4R3_9FIRM|nr:prepilin-type N-terminal cleavage/methylation domain-containing protein [Anaerobranca gottschalkii]SES63354.1 prepilin-type N-terminal cleavage/methylation domain-containing protein [Anaerobranca gottschalkii DSM 13577]